MMAHLTNFASLVPSSGAVRLPAQWCRSNGSALLRMMALFVSFQTNSLHVVAQPPSSPSPTDAKSEEKEPPSLTDLVTKFLKDDKAGGSAELMQQIRKESGDDATKVSIAIRESKLWDAPTELKGLLVFDLIPGMMLRLRFELPENYDPSRPCPVYLNPNPDVISKCGFVSSPPLLSICKPEGILLSVEPSPARNRLLEIRGDSLSLEHLLAVVRKRFRVSDDQVHLLSAISGWNLILHQPDAFASATLFDDTPALPYARQLVEILLPNFRNTQVAATLGHDLLNPVPASSKWTATINQAISEIATSKGLKVEVLSTEKKSPQFPFDFEECRKAVSGSTSARRPLAPKTITHWFRTPAHGRSGWLRQTRWAGDVPNWDQISILPGPKVDHDKYIKDVLKSQMAYIGGTLEGNKITIETRQCESIELLLFDGMVDFSKPIEVTINGKHRHDKVVRPSVPTLLSEFSKTWDSQRLVFAKLSFDIREDAPD